MTERTSMRQVSVRLSEDEANEVERLADDDGRSVANYVRRVVVAHLDEMRGQ